jgi:hypothetical protein
LQRFQRPCYVAPAFYEDPAHPNRAFYAFHSPIRTPSCGEACRVRKGVGPRESLNPARGAGSPQSCLSDSPFFSRARTKTAPGQG